MQKQTNFLTIGEVAHQTGLRPSALRYYESVGLLPAPERSGGQRRYEVGILKQIGIIQTAQKTGFSIKEILTFLESSETETPYAQRLQELAKHKIVELEALIVHAQAMKRVLEAALDCRCASLEDCYLFIDREDVGSQSTPIKAL